MNDRVIASAKPRRVREKKNKNAVAAIRMPRDKWAGTMSRVSRRRPCHHQIASANRLPKT